MTHITTGLLLLTSLAGATSMAGQEAGSTGKSPNAARDFSVSSFADALEHPRWVYVLPTGDVLVAESSTVANANRITLLRDGNGDGIVDTRSVFLERLNQPTAIALVGATLFVADTDSVRAFPYETGQDKITDKGRKILDLPTGDNHWAPTMVANPAGTKLYVGIGGAILETNFDGTGSRIFSVGLRNPQGMDWEPATDALWTAVNERDLPGGDMVPDYLTHVRDAGFYNSPFSYLGQNLDPRVRQQRSLSMHTASLGLAFYRGEAFPRHYRGGAFVGQHGSWNGNEFSGYKVVFVPFERGRPNGAPEPFLTGFLSPGQQGDAYGRPVGVAVDKTGALLVADDVGNMIWRVTFKSAQTMVH